MHDVLVSGLVNQNIDLFYFINSTLDNPFLDVLMTFITNFGSLFAGFLFCLILFIFGGVKAKKVAILGIIALFLTNFAVAILKLGIAEPRPFVTLSHVDLLVNPTDRYSFPSSHAASSFAISTIIGLKYYFNIKGKKFRLIYPLMIFALLISFSRIYVGVHYPFDVLIGAVIGIIFAGIVLKFENEIINRIKNIHVFNRLLKFNLIHKIKALNKLN